MSRRSITLVLVSALALGLLVPLGNAQAPPPPADGLKAFGIFPPGQCGRVNSANQTCEHYDDQLETYASLVTDDDVTDEELATYYHSLQFGTGTEVEDEYSPIDGVTVFRDELGIPHIYADTIENATFALGYVSAEDRLWEMDVLRHAGRGTLSSFVGDGGAEPTFLQMDIATRREGYTEEEVQKMLDDLDDKFGAAGATVQTGLQAYSDGINAYIEQLQTNPQFAEQVPLEYAATGNPLPMNPTEWTPLDTAFLVVLQLRVFGETAGQETENAGVYAQLVKKLGKKLGPQVFDDLLFQNEKKSPASIEKSQAKFPSQNLGKIDPKSIAIPDNAVEIATAEARRAAIREEALALLGIHAPSSNALLVSADKSKTGNPLEVGAPQVGYANPSFFMEVEVHAPGVDFRGPAVPGASALIPLGRGRDYAWTLTTGFSDAVDTRAELLCDPKGGEATEESNGYMFKGKCKEMESRDESFEVHQSPADPESGPPRTEERTFYRTVHGPVFARTKVDGKPVALVKQRFFWMKELDSVPEFYKWNTQVEDVGDFEKAAKDFTMSFNSFYADAEDIAYFHVGFYPKRTEGQHPSLPTWGTGDWEWKGRLPFSSQPHVVNPEQGWVANWNNKPAVGWSNFDGFKFGSVQRVQLLKDGMKSLLSEGKAGLSDLVDVIRDAATRDARAVYVGPKMVKYARGGLAEDQTKESDALDIVDAWIGGGAHRYNRDDDPDHMDDGPALAIFDQWYEDYVHLIFDDELGKEMYDILGGRLPISDYSPAGGSSFFHDFSAYLKNLFNKKAKKKFVRDYCDDMSTDEKETCKSLALKALTQAIGELTEEQGEDMSAWTKDPENIVFQDLGAGSVDEIPWQNRGTWNHIVEVEKDVEGGAPEPGPSGSPSSSPSSSP